MDAGSAANKEARVLSNDKTSYLPFTIMHWAGRRVNDHMQP